MKKLQRDTESRIKYEDEEKKLKEAIFQINSFYSVYDGEFLEELEKFLEKYKQEHDK